MFAPDKVLTLHVHSYKINRSLAPDNLRVDLRVNS